MVGVGMAVSGSAKIAKWIRTPQAQKQSIAVLLANGLVLLILGIAFVLQGEASLVSIGIAWAVLGVSKSVYPLTLFIENVKEYKLAVKYGIEFLFKIGIALLLLFDPFGRFTPHLRILGAELIVYNFRAFGKNNYKKVLK